jgi:HlyD family secretion protein
MKKLVPPLLLVLALGGWWAYRHFTADDATRIAGLFEARTVEVGSLVGGRVMTVESEAGRAIAAGDVLVTLDASLADLEIAQQKAKVASAQAAVDKAQRGPRDEELQRASIAYQAAQTDRRRFEQLWNDGVIGRRDFDQTLVAESTARQNYLERARGSRQEDLAAALASLDGETQRLAFLDRQRQEFTVRSPAAGLVEVLDLRPGDLIAPNAPVASILEDGQLWLRAYLPETRLAEVAVGRTVHFTLDGRPDTYRGTVIEIADRGEYTPRNLQTFEQRQDLVFAVRIRPEPPASGPSPFKAGLSAVVRLDPATSATSATPATSASPAPGAAR